MVHDLDGNEIGEVSRVMIDVAAGFAAFAVIEGAGRSAGDHPVPLQALRGTGDDSLNLSTALLTMDASAYWETGAGGR